MPISEPAPEPTDPPSTADGEPAPTAPASTQEPVDDGPARPLWFSWAIAGVVVAVLAGAAIFLLGGSDDGGSDSVAPVDADPAASAAAVPGGGAGGAGGFGPGTRGTISAIDGDTLTVESTSPDGTSGSTTVETTDETTITESVDGSIDDFEVGDTVLAFGETGDESDDSDGDGMVAASVSESDGTGVGRLQGGGAPPEGFEPPADGEFPEGFEPPADGEFPEGFEPPADGELPEGFEPPQGGIGGPGGQGAPASGEITAIDGDSLTVESEDGSSVTVSFTVDTTFTVTEDRSLDDLAEGDTVLVVGESDDGEVITATSIRVGDDLGAGFGGPGPGGPPGANASDDDEEA